MKDIVIDDLNFLKETVKKYFPKNEYNFIIKKINSPDNKIYIKKVKNKIKKINLLKKELKKLIKKESAKEKIKNMKDKLVVLKNSNEYHKKIILFHMIYLHHK